MANPTHSPTPSEQLQSASGFNSSSTVRSPKHTETVQDYNNIPNTNAPSEAARLLLKAAELTYPLCHDQETLSTNIESASPWDRAFAYRVAESSRLLEEWCEELEAWPWDGNLEAYRVALDDDKSVGHTYETAQKTSGLQHGHSHNQDYLNRSLKEQMKHYDQRLNMIQQKLDELDIEEQKSRVLQSHIRNRSRSLGASSSDDHRAAAQKLAGMSTIVMMTVMQALPNYSYLSTLIESWSVRISLVHQVPRFLGELDKAHKTLDEAWLAIGVRQDRTSGLSRARTVKVGARGMFRESYERIRTNLERHIAQLGQCIDAMLDTLEGNKETLPESWIDAVDSMEVDFSNWTVEAQKKVLQYEFRLGSEQRSSRPASESITQQAQSKNQVRGPTSRRNHMPGSWHMYDSDEDTDEEDEAHKVRFMNVYGASKNLPLSANQSTPNLSRHYHESSQIRKGVSPERSSSSEGIQPTHTDIIRKRIKRHISYPAVRASALLEATKSEEQQSTPTVRNSAAEPQAITPIITPSPLKPPLPASAISKQMYSQQQPVINPTSQNPNVPTPAPLINRLSTASNDGRIDQQRVMGDEWPLRTAGFPKPPSPLSRSTMPETNVSDACTSSMPTMLVSLHISQADNTKSSLLSRRRLRSQLRDTTNHSLELYSGRKPEAGTSSNRNKVGQRGPTDLSLRRSTEQRAASYTDSSTQTEEVSAPSPSPVRGRAMLSIPPIRSLASPSKRRSLPQSNGYPISPSNRTNRGSRSPRPLSMARSVPGSCVSPYSPPFSSLTHSTNPSGQSHFDVPLGSSDANIYASWTVGKDIVENSVGVRTPGKQKWIEEMMARADKAWERHAPSLGHPATETLREEHNATDNVTGAAT